MKSSSAAPDVVWMSRFRAATEAWLRSIRSVTIAGSVSIGVGGVAARGRPHGALVRQRRDEFAAVENRLQCVPDQRIPFPEDIQEGRAARR